jgi:DNA gyrase subunit B
MSYDASAIQVLEGLEAVRHRPGMYIGGTDKDGFHHLLWEVVDNSVDEMMGDHAQSVIVTISDDRKVAEVRDDGRGIPFDSHSSGMSTLDVVFTKLHAGGKFGGKGYEVSGGLHGVGAAVVNALSSATEVTVWRDGKEAKRTYSKGAPLGKLSVVDDRKSRRGTRVVFTPDEEIFGSKLRFDVEEIAERLLSKCYLNPGKEFVLSHQGEVLRYRSERGLEDMLSDKNPTAVTPFWSEKARDSSVSVEVSLAWTDLPKEDSWTFANGIPTKFGGTHLQGVRDMVSKEVRQAVIDSGRMAKKWELTRDDVFDGVKMAISVRLPNPQFQGQTKDRLNNPEVQSAVARALRPSFQTWLAANEQAVVTRVIQSVRARMASRDAQTAVRKTVLSTGPLLPGKLADCSSREVESTELFLVEGDSAGGSAKQGRDRKTQAILPLRGKILNVEGLPLPKVLENQEIKNIIDALGCGIGPTFNADRLRYGKIILLMDADTDGAHISVLVLCLFYRWFRPLIDQGRVFLARPPLYALKTPGGSVYVHTENEMREAVRSRPKTQVTRFKGLGEMSPGELKHTTMDPSTRSLYQVQVGPGEELVTVAMISDLLGSSPERRIEHIVNDAAGYEVQG